MCDRVTVQHHLTMCGCTYANPGCWWRNSRALDADVTTSKEWYVGMLWSQEYDHLSFVSELGLASGLDTKRVWIDIESRVSSSQTAGFSMSKPKLLCQPGIASKNRPNPGVKPRFNPRNNLAVSILCQF